VDPEVRVKSLSRSEPSRLSTRTSIKNEKSPSTTCVHPAGNDKARPSRDTSHGLHIEGKSLYVTPDGDYMDRIIESESSDSDASGPAGLLRGRGQLAKWSSFDAASIMIFKNGKVAFWNIRWAGHAWYTVPFAGFEQ
jgi:hypothetical protein